MAQAIVHTLGDSTLDNYWWLLTPNSSNNKEADKNCVEGQLKTELNSDSVRGDPTYKVVSHAYDGFTTSSVLNGDKIGRVLNGYNSPGHKVAYKLRKMVDANQFTKPLNKLRASVLESPDAVHYVVISVGGNDFRERLSNPIGMLREIPRVHERYLRILEEVKSLSDKNIRPILMFLYRTDANHDPYRIYTVMKVIGVFFTAVNVLSIAGITAAAVAMLAGKVNKQKGLIFTILGAAIFALSSRVIPLKVTKGILSGQSAGMTTLGGLIEKFYKPILAKAREEKIPILDLPNTFNPYEELYEEGIEPNKEGGKVIAEGISYIVKTHKFETPESWIYSKGTKGLGWSPSPNEGDWEVNYMSK
jgi:hypothetical protein